MRITVALAALLVLSACHDPGPASIEPPEMRPVQPEKPPPPRPPEDPDLSTTSAVCTKATPTGDYGDRAAECVEVQGATSIAAGSSRTYMCRGWGRSSPVLNDMYEVSAARTRSWGSANQSYLQVAQTSSWEATVTAVAPGTTSLRCFIDGVLGSLEVTVTGTRTLASMFVLPNSLTLQAGQSDQVAVQYVDNYNQVNQINPIPVVDEWASDNSAVATVARQPQFGGQAGLVTAVGTPSPTQNGVAHVRARVGGLWSSTGTINVTPAPQVTRVNIAPQSVTIAVNEITQLTATAYDQLGRVVSGRSASWDPPNQPNIALTPLTPMTVQVRGTHWGSANVRSYVDGVWSENTVPITVMSEGNISGYYVSALSPAPGTFTGAGTYSLTPTTSTAGTPPITYKWEITYSDNSRPAITTGFQSGPFPLSVHAGAYKVYVRVTPRQLYGTGFPTNWTYVVCTGGNGPLNVAANWWRPEKPDSNGGKPYAAPPGCTP